MSSDVCPEDDDDDAISFHSADEGSDVEDPVTDPVLNRLEDPVLKIPDKKDEANVANTSSYAASSSNEDLVKSDTEIHSGSCEIAPASPSTDDAADGWEVEDWDDIKTDNTSKVASNSNRTLKSEISYERIPSGQPETVPQPEMLQNLRRSNENVRDVCYDDKETNIKCAIEKIVDSNPSSGGSFWTGWNSIISVASDSFSTLSNTVGEGLINVLETVETSLGAPTPEEMAKMSLEEKLELKRKVDEVKEPWPASDKDDCDSAEEFASDGASQEDISSGYQSDTSNSLTSKKAIEGRLPDILKLTNVLNTTGRQLVAGSVDALELIGKKTFDILTTKESDTGRRKFVFNRESYSLSQMLRELKEQNVAELTKEDAAASCSFSIEFEKHNGIVNLEALEMLSESCKQQIDQQLRKVDTETKKGIKDLLKDVQEKLSLEHTVDFEEILVYDNCASTVADYAAAINVSCDFSKLIEVCSQYTDWYNKIESYSDEIVEIQKKDTIQKLFTECIAFFAHFTAAVSEVYRKLAQIWFADKVSLSYDSFVRLTALCREIPITWSKKFTTYLNSLDVESTEFTEQVISQYITDLFLEADNCATYIEEAHNLTIPVVQLIALQKATLCS